MASKGFLFVVLVLVFSSGGAFSARVIGLPLGPNPIPSGPLSGYLNGFEVPSGPYHEDRDAPPPPSPQHSQPIIPPPTVHGHKHFGYLNGFEERKRLVPSGPNQEGHDAPPPPPPPQHSQPVIPPPIVPPQHSQPIIPPPTVP
ncbi:uncharacterized protein A4U43_C09F13990 [Asparagus officinalis]|uniref:Uncharacterized protein n=1 Tax=Asparagus officinalis TaxID=4686 RepID=A0A5P1EAQ1_ASPOF|nr:proline-rich protein HaeIII subfamily 1-like [Asparagus officinalis]ONK58527.1 uncharacterized protein A4U43_C09F13990 [Asparagus officinalis]